MSGTNGKSGAKFKTIDSLPKDWREIIKMAYELGKGNSVICKNLHISFKVFFDLQNNYPEFKETIDLYYPLHVAWWEEHLRKQATGEQKGNVAATIFYMKNKITGYAEHDESGKATDERPADDRERAKRMARIIKFGEIGSN